MCLNFCVPSQTKPNQTTLLNSMYFFWICSGWFECDLFLLLQFFCAIIFFITLFGRKTHYGRIALFTCAIFILVCVAWHNEDYTHNHQHVNKILSTNPCSFAIEFDSIYLSFLFTLLRFDLNCIIGCVTLQHTSTMQQSKYRCWTMMYKLHFHLFIDWLL